MWRDAQQAHSGKASLAISNDHQYEEPVSNNWAQKLPYTPKGATLRLSAYIRTENADAASACVQCWSAGGKVLLSLASTAVFRGDHEWVQARSSPFTVPEQSQVVIVRAALTGVGKAWFDDFLLEEVGLPVAPEDDLAKSVSGDIVREIPITKDCMVLAYLPQWNHGRVDNLAVADNDGGVRTLLAWDGNAVSAAEAQRNDRRFLIALYSRETRTGEAPGKLQVHELLQEWPERTAWPKQPRFAPGPAAAFDFVSGEGWKLFDVTTVLRDQTKASRKPHGVVLRFAREDRKEAWSGYAFPSREGAGKWATLRPRLLVVEPKAPSSE